ncbi:MAG: Cysteine synthase [Parcubacteria group bacterium GW2011_GWC2_38_7]|nr:MAG: Cysteine synthase [Parcubacteria group bacterium GW2011_GWC2_38_7]
MDKCYLDAIGNTPLVKLEKITKGLKANIYVKLDFLNPGGSIKDRIARYMVEKAEREGKLKPGDTIIENSSGNTALGLAIVALQKGYKLKIVIRDTTSKEKVKMLSVLGAEVILVDASLPPENPKSSYNLLYRSA